jgi:ATP-binding cassette subfamily F protein uup
VRDLLEEEVRTLRLDSGHRVSSGQLLERFLFHAALQRAYIEELSGGERRRLELLRVLAGAPNVLLLDEPSGDLDLDTLRVLEEELERWPGAVVVASHDRYLLDRVCGQVVAVEDGRLRHFPGGWQEWRAQRAGGAGRRTRGEGEGGRSRAPSARGGREAADGRPRRPRKRSYREERELADAERRLAELGERRDALAAELERVGHDHERAAELGRELAAVTEELSQLEDRWLELSMIGEKP